MIACPECRKPMAFVQNLVVSADHDPNDERSRRFVEQALERDPSVEGSTFHVYESRECCGCGCRRYLPHPEPESSHGRR